jgi:hypothetical protein
MTFRIWLNNLWYQHKTEVLQLTGHPVQYDANVYFSMYKWWLKQKYKEEMKK